ncbi:type III PLP-dependent enzyme [Streptomyces hygroscopicus]|uniref:type III PLP-dependent enzyme n=1 Tax=Streptomyces hygroscopicus TaxID=1912 RepID=UPI0033F962D1
MALTGDDLPAYVYDLAALRTYAQAVRAALPPGLELYYAAKANPAPPVLQALAPHVTGYEVASGGEVEHVRAAVPGMPLAFGGPGKTEGELRRALTLGVERFHVESEQELRLLAEAAENARPSGTWGTKTATGASGTGEVAVLLRVNLPLDGAALGGAALAMGGRPSPFGLDPEAVERCLPLFTREGPLRLRGIHAHLASGLDAPAQVAMAARIADWARKLSERHGLGLTEVNVGGGMGVDYAHPDRRFDWAAYGAGMADLALRHPDLTLRIEPGRALTVHCGWYVTEVLDLKHSGGEAFAVLRGGTHHLRTPATKQHDQPFQVLPVDTWTRPWARPAAREEPVTLVGQLCTPKDVLARRVPVGALRVGDRVAFAMAGAYAWNISHHDFLMHPKPGFHYLDE